MKYGTVILLVFSIKSFGQIISEKLIITDTKDSLYIHADNISFDAYGNYCFEIKQNGKKAFFTNTRKFIGYQSFTSIYGGNGERLSYTNSSFDSIDKPWYYRNAKSTKILGPVIGKLEKYMTSNTSDHIAIATSYLDTVYYYVNGKLVSKNLKNDLESFDIDHYEWCAFSNNGNTIYYIKKGAFYYLFVNDKVVDRSPNNFNELHINNHGDYIYAEGQRPKTQIKGYEYMFFIHAKNKRIGPVRTVWYNDLTAHNGYYYSGDDNGPEYIIINNKLYKGLERVANIILIDKKNSLFIYKQKGAKNSSINVNGKDYTPDVDSIFYASMDVNGDFAFYGLKNQHLYKVVNGKKMEEPITSHGVRAIPLYINPQGISLHVFQTNDSLYLYQDDKLLLKPLSKNSNFKRMPHEDVLPNNYIRGKAENHNSLFYLEFDTLAYWVFNGAFSKPMIPKSGNFYLDRESIGAIVAGTLNEYGFFIIQKIDNKKYLININNEAYAEIDDIDSILRGNTFFDDKELIFYGIKESSFYQFSFQVKSQ